MVQCQKPLWVGASGSNTVSARLFVPSGTLRQLISGETFVPEQPNELNTWALAMVPPSATSELPMAKPPPLSEWQPAMANGSATSAHRARTMRSMIPPHEGGEKGKRAGSLHLPNRN